MRMLVELVQHPFDPWKALQDYQQRQLPAGQFGATAVFVGTMRDFNKEESVEVLFLDHYAGMTERELHRIVEEAQDRWPIQEVLVMHRVGEIRPAEPIVLVVVWSVHRGPAFESCRWIMEALKSRAPFWKKETGPAGERWVEKNTPG